MEGRTVLVTGGAGFVSPLAARTSAAESLERPRDYWRTNVEGTLNVLKAAVDAGAKRVVLASSAAVYGNQEANPKVESMRPAPPPPPATTEKVRGGAVGGGAPL